MFRKIEEATGLLKGFWYLFTFSPKGIMNKTADKNSIDKIPIHLSDKIRNRLNVGKRYHSGRISNGVAKGVAGSIIRKGEQAANPNMSWRIPKITTGNMYKISLGHAGSP